MTHLKTTYQRTGASVSETDEWRALGLVLCFIRRTAPTGWTVLRAYQDDAGEVRFHSTSPCLSLCAFCTLVVERHCHVPFLPLGPAPFCGCSICHDRACRSFQVAATDAVNCNASNSNRAVFLLGEYKLFFCPIHTLYIDLFSSALLISVTRKFQLQEYNYLHFSA